MHLIMEGLQIAAEPDFPDLVRAAIILLRNPYQQNSSKVAETWRKATSTEPPELIILARRVGPSIKQANAFSQP
ncbi:hypothetical protein Aph01nite_36540 [Acrocarpospora phusangensis]|uniref:Uncharacterized protein n=1 Tax=Acrocarpospora phusangensis TaxID=1070424 RepID=A0A919QCS5_9ACTN|nr:hypothetical protein Aph01nite_36540 [Acrocarpospora phusangensis]